MALSFIGGDAAAVAGGTTASVNLPVGIAQDDITCVAAQATAASLDADLDMALDQSGYTETNDLHQVETIASNMGAYYKVQGATPDSVVSHQVNSDTSRANAIAMHTWRGVDTTTPMDATPTTAQSGNSSLINGAAITTATADAVVLSLGVATSETTGGVSGPSGYGNVYWAGVDVTRDGDAAIASISVASPGSEDPGAWSGIATSTNDSWIAVTMALRPASGADHNLLANDVQSASEVTAPAIGQTHAILANDVESASEVTAPAVGQVHVLLADDVESGSEVTAPAIAIVTPLFAEDVESASEVTAPAVGQVHGLLANDVESASEVSGPAVGQAHALLADDVESASEVTAPALGQAHVLAADDIEAASSVSAPSLTILSTVTVDTHDGGGSADDYKRYKALIAKRQRERERRERELRAQERQLRRQIANEYDRLSGRAKKKTSRKPPRIDPVPARTIEAAREVPRLAPLIDQLEQIRALLVDLQRSMAEIDDEEAAFMLMAA